MEKNQSQEQNQQTTSGAADAAATRVNREDAIRGSLLAGAAGDALGAVTEFDSIDQIRSRFGPNGITGYHEDTDAEGNPRGFITDDTQMTLFTVAALAAAAQDGLAWDDTEAVNALVERAYAGWLDTQEGTSHAVEDDRDFFARFRPLVDNPALRYQRAPGNACIAGCEMIGAVPVGQRNSDSAGCGTVMRSAPYGLLPCSLVTASELAFAGGLITHAHHLAVMGAPMTAELVHHLAAGKTLEQACGEVITSWYEVPEAMWNVSALMSADSEAKKHRNSGTSFTPEEMVEKFGEGKTAESCLAIAVYCALAAPAHLSDTEKLRWSILKSVNHSGDNDSTGAVCGNIVGAAYGASAIPAEWVDQLEERELVEEAARALAALSPAAQEQGLEASTA